MKNVRSRIIYYARRDCFSCIYRYDIPAWKRSSFFLDDLRADWQYLALQFSVGVADPTTFKQLSELMAFPAHPNFPGEVSLSGHSAIIVLPDHPNCHLTQKSSHEPGPYANGFVCDGCKQSAPSSFRWNCPTHGFDLCQLCVAQKLNLQSLQPVQQIVRHPPPLDFSKCYHCGGQKVTHTYHGPMPGSPDSSYWYCKRCDPPPRPICGIPNAVDDQLCCHGVISKMVQEICESHGLVVGEEEKNALTERFASQCKSQEMDSVELRVELVKQISTLVVS